MMNTNSKTITLQELFSNGPAAFNSDSLIRIQDLNSGIAAEIATRLGLLFLDEKSAHPDNVCLANSVEVRPEYRTSCTTQDLFDYIYAVLYSSGQIAQSRNFSSIDPPTIMLPQDTESFWTLVQLGQRLQA